MSWNGNSRTAGRYLDDEFGSYQDEQFEQRIEQLEALDDAVRLRVLEILVKKGSHTVFDLVTNLPDSIHILSVRVF